MYSSIDEIIKKNKNIGQYWFSTDTMKLFKTRISSKIYGGKYFVTSDIFMYNKRLYTVREAKPDGSIGTIGPFNRMTYKQAHKVAKELAKTN